MKTRPIKFRAWDGNEMHYKDLGAFVSIDDMTITPVKCELMQFTGLTDSNGKEIYEGDVVDVMIDYKIYRRMKSVEVTYKNGAYGIIDKDMIFCAFMSFDDIVDFEVTGNIYETKNQSK